MAQLCQCVRPVRAAAGRGHHHLLRRTGRFAPCPPGRPAIARVAARRPPFAAHAAPATCSGKPICRPPTCSSERCSSGSSGSVSSCRPSTRCSSEPFQGLVDEFFRFVPRFLVALLVLSMAFLVGNFLWRATLLSSVNAGLPGARLLSGAPAGPRDCDRRRDGPRTTGAADVGRADRVRHHVRRGDAGPGDRLRPGRAGRRQATARASSLRPRRNATPTPRPTCNRDAVPSCKRRASSPDIAAGRIRHRGSRPHRVRVHRFSRVRRPAAVAGVAARADRLRRLAVPVLFSVCRQSAAHQPRTADRGRTAHGDRGAQPARSARPGTSTSRP